MAADATVETLQIQIEASSSDAAKKVNELAQALRNLKDASKGGAGLSNVTTELDKIKNSGLKATASFGGLKKLFGAVGFKQITKYLGGAVNSINEYIETLNLFKVSMGGFYDEAYEYAELVNEKLGVDPAQWMKAQGVFMSMGKGFGMSEKQAYGLSKSLTELSYDIASLYDEDIQQGMTRLQSALAGEIEPIRRLGVSISQATLEEYALTLGIEESVSAMTEQEKALLRSLKLIEGFERIGAVGDFAKTLESPANAIRVLNQQFTQFKRAIGSVFLPVVVQALPYIQAFTSLLTDLISKLAVFVGFTIPEWDANDWADGMSDLEGKLTGAAEAAKEAKKQLAGIDELTVLSDNSGGGTGGAGGISDWAKDLEIPSLWNEEDIAAIETQASKLKEKLEPILDLALKIGAALLAIKVADALFTGLDTFLTSVGLIEQGVDGLSGIKNIVIGATLMIAGVAIAWDAIHEAITEGLDWTNLAEMIIGDALFIAGAVKIGGAFGKQMFAGFLAVALSGASIFVTSFIDAIKNGLSDENSIGMLVGGAVTGAGIGGALGGPMGALMGALIGTAAAGMVELGLVIAQNWDQIKTEAKASWDAMKAEWDDTIKTFKKAGEMFTSWFSEKWDNFWGGVVEFFTFCKDELEKGWDAAVEEISTKFNEWSSNFKLGWDKFWESAGETVDGMINGVISSVEKGLNWCIDALNSLKWDVPDWVPWVGGKSFGFNIDRISLGRVDFFENGGFPDHGQMFIAREAGPELVGQIGNRTAVANNDQIVSGIAYGVRDANLDVVNAILAVSQQIIETINNKDSNIYFDGEKVTKRTSEIQNRQTRMYGKPLQHA